MVRQMYLYMNTLFNRIAIISRNYTTLKTVVNGNSWLLRRFNLEPLLWHGNIDQTLVNSFHGLLNFEIVGLDCRLITTEYMSHVHCIFM